MLKKKSVLITCLALVTCLCMLGFSGCEKSNNTGEAAGSAKSAEAVSAEESAEDTEEASGDLLSGMHHVTMELANYGTVSIELNADKAPVTVTNFVKLAKEGFYDGLTFHRIIPDQFVQGGDPLGNGRGGSGEHIVGEFAANGSDNDLSHTAGAIAMARNQNPDSASSQFFIDVTDMSQSFDGQYAVFGYVTDGLELLKKMSEDAVQYIADRNGTIPAPNQPVITSVKVID